VPPAGSERPGVKVHDVNLIGEYNIAGEFWHVLPLFDELGLRVLGNLSGDARFREVQTLHRSAVNMMVCSKAMINVARLLQSATARALVRGQLLWGGRCLPAPCGISPG
jgi:nitrogenase molybdenum-cofactor synthesis protein NifE